MSWFRSVSLAKKLYGLAGMTEVVCRDLGLKCMELSNSSAKAFVGANKVPGKDRKAAMVEAIRAYGFAPETADEADAIAIRLYALHKLYPGTRTAFSLDLGALGAAADNG